MARQVLPIAGAIVGAYFGNPQLGWAIGSIIGNAVDPVVIKGPKIGEAGVQTSAEGVYRPIVYGTASVKGNVIDRGNRSIRREESGGKGGPVTETQRVSWTFAIRIAEGPLTGLLRIWQDEKLVYDVRAGTAMAAESEKFAEKFTLYLGGEDQLPDADLEAFRGAGNVNAYRGSAYIVFPNFDLTDQRERIPDFRFEVSREIVTVDPGSWFVGPIFEPGLTSGPSGFVRGPTPDALADWREVPVSSCTRISSAGGALFVHGTTGSAVSFDRGISFSSIAEILSANDNVEYNGIFYFCKDRRSTDGLTWEAIPGITGTVIVGCKARVADGLVAVATNTALGAARVFWNYTGEAPWNEYVPPGDGISGPSLTLGTGRIAFFVTTYGSLYSDDVFSTDDDTATTGILLSWEGASADSWMAKRSPNEMRSGDGSSFTNVLFTTFPWQGNSVNSVKYGNGWWGIVGTSGTTRNLYGSVGITEFPIIDTFSSGSSVSITYIEPVQTAGTVGPYDRIALSSIASDLHERAGHTSADYNVAALTDELVGLVLANDFTYADAIRTLMPIYFFDASEHDSGTGYRVHYVKRGAEPVAALTVDDLIDAPDKTIRHDSLEYPLKLHLAYENPTVGYAAAKATARRSSPDLNVIGEIAVSVPVVFDLVDEPTQIADKLLKIQWAEAGGTEEFTIGEEWLRLVPTDVVTVTFRDQTRRLRVEKQRIEDGQIALEMIIDRQSALESNVTGAGLPSPTAPPSTIRGLTGIVWCNLPTREIGSIVSHEPAFVVGLTNNAAGWIGAMLEVSTDSGATWVRVHDETAPAAVGTCAALASGSSWAIDRNNSLTVTFPDVLPDFVIDNTMVSASMSQIQNRANLLVVQKSDSSEPELIQFETATQTSPRVWTLTGLHRGCQNTVARAHTAGETAMVLSTATLILRSDIGGDQEIMLRAVSYDTSPDSAISITRTFSPVKSLIELAPSPVAEQSVSANTFGQMGAYASSTIAAGNIVEEYIQPGRHIGFVFVNCVVNGRTIVRGFHNQLSAQSSTARITYSNGVAELQRTILVNSYLRNYGWYHVAFTYLIQDILTDAEQTTAFGSVPVSLDVTVELINSDYGPGTALEYTV